MNIEFDPQVDALYLRLAEGDIVDSNTPENNLELGRGLLLV